MTETALSYSSLPRRLSEASDRSTLCTWINIAPPSWVSALNWEEAGQCLDDGELSSTYTGVLTTSTLEVTRLNLCCKSLDGTVPQVWSNLNSVHGIILRNNQLDGRLPLGWTVLSGLRILDLANNRLVGSLPEAWSALSITWLGVEKNYVTGRLPDSWSTMNIRELYMHDNQLSGTLPATWSTLRTLSILWGHNNGFSGELPVLWSALSNIKDVSLASNGLRGSLPSSYSTFHSISRLDLSNNGFTGRIPEEWSRMTKLVALGLANNGLKGSLPGKWSTLAKLTSLDLFNNGEVTGILSTFLHTRVASDRLLHLYDSFIHEHLVPFIPSFFVLIMICTSVLKTSAFPPLQLLPLQPNWGTQAPSLLLGVSLHCYAN